jgi:hypothetical protein
VQLAEAKFWYQSAIFFRYIMSPHKQQSLQYIRTSARHQIFINAILGTLCVIADFKKAVDGETSGLSLMNVDDNQAKKDL